MGIKIKPKDDKNRVEDVEEKIDDAEEIVSEKIVEGEDEENKLVMNDFW